MLCRQKRSTQSYSNIITKKLSLCSTMYKGFQNQCKTTKKVDEKAFSLSQKQVSKFLRLPSTLCRLRCSPFLSLSGCLAVLAFSSQPSSQGIFKQKFLTSGKLLVDYYWRPCVALGTFQVFSISLHRKSIDYLLFSSFLGNIDNYVFSICSSAAHVFDIRPQKFIKDSEDIS